MPLISQRYWLVVIFCLGLTRLVPSWSVVGLAMAGETDGADFSSAAGVLRNAVEQRVFPGCAVAVGTSRELLWCRGFGHLTYDRETKATPATMYDLASLTKVVSTTTVVMMLVDSGKLRLRDRVAKFVPEFIDDSDDDGVQGGLRHVRREVTVEHLLTHCSGLPAWKPFYESVDSYQKLLHAVARTPLESHPGTKYRYSDLGFILLGEVAARAGDKPLAVLEREMIFVPLKMNSTVRNPPTTLLSRIAPTEEVRPGAGTFVHGAVHDENARAGGGITGHAGLFSTAEDLAILARQLLRGLRDESAIFSPGQLQPFVRRRGLVAGSSRALGWDTPSGDSSAGSIFSRRSFGHTGFTGTSVWLDTERDLFVVLLSHRVHPTRENSRIHPVRRGLADAVARTIDEARDSKAPPAK